MMKGPDPVGSVMLAVAGVDAMRAGMMKGTFELGLPSASSTRPQGSFSVRRTVFGSTATSSAVRAASCWPRPSRSPQRFSDATTSAEVTAAPSWNFRPSRSVKV